jgi:hypothetical protein
MDEVDIEKDFLNFLTLPAVLREHTFISGITSTTGYRK